MAQTAPAPVDPKGSASDENKAKQQAQGQKNASQDVKKPLHPKHHFSMAGPHWNHTRDEPRKPVDHTYHPENHHASMAGPHWNHTRHEPHKPVDHTYHPENHHASMAGPHWNHSRHEPHKPVDHSYHPENHHASMAGPHWNHSRHERKTVHPSSKDKAARESTDPKQSVEHNHEHHVPPMPAPHFHQHHDHEVHAEDIPMPNPHFHHPHGEPKQPVEHNHEHHVPPMPAPHFHQHHDHELVAEDMPMPAPHFHQHLVVCVTGCTGYLGSWIVKYALEAGHEVRGTTRHAKNVEFLKKLPGALERLKLYAGCDLEKPSTFNAAIKGSDVVIHCASPLFRNKSDKSGREKIVKPAVEGTRMILEACEKCSVKKVVLTSSNSATYMSYGTKPADYVYSEKDWSDVKLLEKKKDYYSMSKTMAEQLAWEFAKKHDCPFKLSVMNPSVIFGPMLPGQPHLNLTCYRLLELFAAKKIEQDTIVAVDVRDVARAHVTAAGQNKDWVGWGQRNMLVSTCVTYAEIVDILKGSTKVPEKRKALLPTKVNSKPAPPTVGAPPPAKTKVNVDRSKKPVDQGGLGIHQYIGIKEMVEATYQTLMENGLDDPKKYTLDQ